LFSYPDHLYVEARMFPQNSTRSPNATDLSRSIGSIEAQPRSPFQLGGCVRWLWLTFVLYSVPLLTPTATHATASLVGQGELRGAERGSSLPAPAALPDPQLPTAVPSSTQDTPPAGTATGPSAPVGGTPPATAATRVTQDDLKTQSEAALATDLDEETKKKVQEWYKSAAERVSRLEALPQLAADLQQRLATADQRAEQWRSAGQLSVEPARFDLNTSTLADVQKEAADTEAQIRQWKERIAALDTERVVLVDRRREITTRITSLPERLAEAQNQLQASAPEGEPAVVTQARRTATQAEVALWEAELPVLNLERDYIDGEISRDILRLERDSLTAKIDLETRWLQQVTEAVNLKREQEAQRALAEAELQRASVPLPLKTLADEIAELALEQKALSERLSAQQSQKDKVSERLKKLREQFDSSQQKVRSVGLTSTIGFLLRKQRGDIPTATELNQLRLVPGRISDVQLQLLQVDDQRNELILFDNLALQLLNLTGEQRERSSSERFLIQEATDLLKAKRESLDNLHRNLDAYFNMLVETDTAVVQLTELSGNYRNYIDERILWIPSSRPLFRYFDVMAIDRWLFQPELLQQFGAAIIGDFMSEWFWWLLFGTLWFTTKVQGYHWRREIVSLAREASSGTCSSFRPTYRALFGTIMISLPWPALLWFLGWRVDAVVNLTGDALRSSMEIQGLGKGLAAAGLGLLPLECLRNLCRDSGLGMAHFGWSSLTLRSVGRLLRVVIFVGLPLVFLTTALHWVDPVLGEDLLERLCFLVACGVFLLATYRTFEPTQGLLRNYYSRHQGGWSERLRYLWFTLGCLTPITLALLTMVGYYYSAYQLSLRLYAMFWLVIGLMVGSELIARWILVQRRRVLIEQAKQRRAQAAVALTATEAISPPVDADVAAAAAVDAQKDWQEKLAQQTKQSQNLLTSVVVMIAIVGSWLIWADVIPALRVVYQQNLWTIVETVSTANGTNTGDAPITKEVVRAITPTDLLQALLVLLMTFVIFRNLPGLIDILVLNQLPIDASSRNAIAAVLSYLVIVIGTIWSARCVGVYWTQVQWLVTALTFGLAFGLQEIFANFVSGMIILFERPVRVGDVVTVDGVTGVVTQTRARATTIRDFDLKELLVPNKEFITGRVLNWTLSDEVTRLVLPVGIAYGSDVVLASRLLLEATQNHPQVMADPAPSVTFEAFGESALNLVVRAYVAKLGDRLRVTSELLTQFTVTLDAHQIEIPFPQRDLHIRSLPPAWANPPTRQTPSGSATASTPELPPEPGRS